MMFNCAKTMGETVQIGAGILNVVVSLDFAGEKLSC